MSSLRDRIDEKLELQRERENASEILEDIVERDYKKLEKMYSSPRKAYNKHKIPNVFGFTAPKYLPTDAEGESIRKRILKTKGLSKEAKERLGKTRVVEDVYGSSLSASANRENYLFGPPVVVMGNKILYKDKKTKSTILAHELGHVAHGDLSLKAFLGTQRGSVDYNNRFFLSGELLTEKSAHDFASRTTNVDKKLQKRAFSSYQLSNSGEEIGAYVAAASGGASIGASTAALLGSIGKLPKGASFPAIIAGGGLLGLGAMAVYHKHKINQANRGKLESRGAEAFVDMRKRAVKGWKTRRQKYGSNGLSGA